MARALTRLAEFRNAMEAGLAQGLLAEAGIEAELTGVTASSWAAGEVLATQGVGLEVRTEDADRARELLATQLGGRGELTDAFRDDEALAAEALALPREEEEIGAEGEDEEQDDNEVSAGAGPSTPSAVDHARRAFALALLGLFLGTIPLAGAAASILSILFSKRWRALTPRWRLALGVALLWSVGLTALALHGALTGSRWWWIHPLA